MMSQPERPARDSRLLILGLLLLLVLLVGGGYYVWTNYNPFFDRSPRFQEAQALQTAVRQRPLTPDEFAQCLRLCESGNTAVQVSAIASAEAAVSRSPGFKPQTVEVLKRVAVGGDAAATSASAVLKRLAPPPSP